MVAAEHRVVDGGRGRGGPRRPTRRSSTPARRRRVDRERARGRRPSAPRSPRRSKPAARRRSGRSGGCVVGVVLPLPGAGDPGDLRRDHGVRVAAREVGVGDAAPAAGGGDAADDAVRVTRRRRPGRPGPAASGSARRRRPAGQERMRCCCASPSQMARQRRGGGDGGDEEDEHVHGLLERLRAIVIPSVPVVGEVHVVLRVAGPGAAPAPADGGERGDRGR